MFSEPVSYVALGDLLFWQASIYLFLFYTVDFLGLLLLRKLIAFDRTFLHKCWNKIEYILLKRLEDLTSRTRPWKIHGLNMNS